MTTKARLSERSGSRAAEHAGRQGELYGRIWGADPDYGTRMIDVWDTVDHRIAPHLSRIGGVESVIDFGAGDGRFLTAMYHAGLMRTGVGVDFHAPTDLPYCIGWRRQSLWQPIDTVCEYAISTDTLEHIPPDMVPAVIENIRASAPHGFLRISTRQDIYGTVRGLHLHETVEPPEWWLDRLNGFELHSWRIYPGHAIEVWY